MMLDKVNNHVMNRTRLDCKLGNKFSILWFIRAFARLLRGKEFRVDHQAVLKVIDPEGCSFAKAD